MDYRPAIIQRQPRIVKQHTPESRYWRRFKHPVFVKEFGPVTSVHFSPVSPHRYAVTSGSQIQIYAPRTQKITKTISRFKEIARSGTIRHDGKLVVAGDDAGLVQIFDINSRAILRTMDEHKQPVYVTKFSKLATTQVLSCSDDTTVKIWDIPSQSPINTFTDHTDYVRSGLISSSNSHIILTGSYDSTVRLFDTRTGSCEMVMGSAESGHAPVEEVLMFPSGTMALSASGPILRAWDLVAGGRCLRAVSNHQKSVTCMAFDGSAGRLLTGGLDQMVKVYDVSTYKVVHTMRYSAPILCLAVSPDDTHIAAGMTDGTFSVRRRQPKASESQAAQAKNMSQAQGTYERIMSGNIGTGTLKNKKVKEKATGDPNELRVESKRRKRLREYDRLLKGFKYSAALDSVLRKRVPPTTSFSLITELIHRDGLKAALSGRDDVLLEPVLQLLLKYVNDPRFGELVCDVASIVIELYTPVIGQSPIIDNLFGKLKKKVDAELRLQKEITQVRGALDMILSASLLSA